MKILILNQEEGEWDLVESAEYRAETELQKLLSESPSLISINEIREGASPLVTAVREVGLPGSGNTDILAFNSSGDIVVVECKLASNQEIKRKVIAQVLEYGAYLWNMSYEELNERVFLCTNKNLAELVAKATGDPEWEEEAFRTAIEENLTNGSFVLVIAVDEMNEELNRTMRFLNTCGNPEFDFSVLEMKRFHRDQMDILVPHLHGVIPKVTPPKHKWDPAKFFPEMERQHGPRALSVARRILEWTKPRVTHVWWGEGRQYGSFVPIYNHQGNDHRLFAVYTLGVVEIYFQWYARKQPFASESLRRELQSRLNELEGVDIPDEGLVKRPTIRLTILDAGDNLARFFEIFDWVLETIKAS